MQNNYLPRQSKKRTMARKHYNWKKLTFLVWPLAVLLSFIGLVDVLDGGRIRGWAIYAGGAVVAIYCHTTMVLWPVIATVAVLGDAAMQREWRWRNVVMLLAADIATMLASGWVLIMAFAQMRSQAAANITWLMPLGWVDFWTTCNLQLLAGGLYGSVAMAAAMVLGLWRGWRVRAVRLALWITLGTVIIFKAADGVHPIVSDFTLHWAFNFTALIAAAALCGTKRFLYGAALVVLSVAGLVDLQGTGQPFVPQNWRQTVQTVAARRDTVLLASHESIGVVIEQACLVEFGSTRCPFPLVVMADPRQTDNWAFGGYHGVLVAPDRVHAVLGQARVVYAFSRYYYTPLEHLGMRAGDWPNVYWDDGELIGPIPVRAFDPPAPHKPDPDAQYTGAPDPQ